jgi:AraC family transcriptional regulator of adaptative response / DNA-3-methyladenine glycosylase II
MKLDWKICSRARLSRDARFDGKFFIGVAGSGVYCRPICPAPTAKEKNVRYFSSAAAAAEAGFRPCLRCRPECSPGTPAWQGTSNTVSRALRLIGESGLEDGGVESLAERLAWVRATFDGCFCGTWARRRARWRERDGFISSRNSSTKRICR